MAAKKQQTKVASTGAKKSNGAASRPVRGAMSTAPYELRYNVGNIPGANRTRKPAPKKKVEKPVPVKKNKRRERDYFFIMRRGVCFVLMLLAIVWIAVFAMSYLQILPEYTSFLIQPDLTPADERLEVESGEMDADGNVITILYEDKTAYVPFIDPIAGALKALVGVDLSGEGENLSAFYDGTLAILAPDAVEGEEIDGTEDGEVAEGEDDVIAEAAGENDDTADEEAEEGTEDGAEEGEVAEEETVTTYPPQVSTNVISDAAREADGMMSIAAMAWQYFPVVIVVGVVMALIIFIIALLSLFGRRIFKGFGVLSFIMLIAGLVAAVAGLAAACNYMGAPQVLEDGTVVSILDFSKIVDFLMGPFNGYPETAIDPETTAEPMKMVAGYGLLIILVIPIVMFILSFFARKKVPYSIFDK